MDPHQVAIVVNVRTRQHFGDVINSIATCPLIFNKLLNWHASIQRSIQIEPLHIRLTSLECIDNNRINYWEFICSTNDINSSLWIVSSPSPLIINILSFVSFWFFFIFDFLLFLHIITKPNPKHTTVIR